MALYILININTLVTHFQTKFNSIKTLKSKNIYEQLMYTYHVQIKAYHTDNSLFDDKLLHQDIQNSHKHIKFCGVNKQYRNGVVELQIGILTIVTCTFILHEMLKRPSQITTKFWPLSCKSY